MVSRKPYKTFLIFLLVLLTLPACNGSDSSMDEGVKKIVSRDSQGRVKEETQIKNEKPILKRHYRKGRLYLETNYLEGGIIHKTWFYPGGGVSDTRSYKNGKRHGRWAWWGQNGKLRSDEWYEEGKLTKNPSRTGITRDQRVK